MHAAHVRGTLVQLLVLVTVGKALDKAASKGREHEKRSQQHIRHSNETNFEPCDSVCDMHGISATCGDRIEYSAQHEFWGAADKCEKAHARVSSQCFESCRGCLVKNSGCHAKSYWKPEWGSTTTPSFTGTESKGCSTVCHVDGKRGTCKDHIQKVAEAEYSLAPISCTLAYAWVLERCAQCSVCPSIHASCTTAPPPPTTTRTSSTSTSTKTATSTRTSSTSTGTSTTVSSTSTTETGTTTTSTRTTTTETTTSTISSTTTTTPKGWFAFLGVKEEQVEGAAWQPHGNRMHMPLLCVAALTSVALAAIGRVRSRAWRQHLSHPFSFFRQPWSGTDVELAESLEGVE